MIPSTASRLLLATLGLTLGVACAPEATNIDAQHRTALAESELRLNHIQAKGTHNSYHIDSWFPVPEWQYTHDALGEQANNGVRKFELDLHYNPVRDRIDVFHAIVIDRRTQCRSLTECLQDVRAWSDANRDHHPIFFLLEPKVNPPGTDPEMFLELLESTIAREWPLSRIVTPDLVRGDHENLAQAITTDGWPYLDDVRGRVFFVLHETEELRDIYTEGGQDVPGKLIFPQSDPGDPFAAFMIRNSPESDFDTIRDLVEQGYIVRTRSDSSLEWDEDQVQAALDSGAHIISTDFPYDDEGGPYLEIPDGNPSRCNPLIAPEGCTTAMVEDL